ncbi:somatostatin receptor type 4-like [Ptychodera flava]|uniref:somatostatin receptor type 4-like n=1 Tax=Ptychodera flava TaxID=63121 RepID=UPI00396A949A
MEPFNVSSWESDNYSVYGEFNNSNDRGSSVLDCMGSLRFQWILALFITSVGMLANIAFMFVVARIKAMRTFTNMYLVNLAAADTFSLFISFASVVCSLIDPVSCITLNTDNKEIVCALTYISHVAVFTSMFTITVVGIERHIAVCRPLSAASRNMFSDKCRSIQVIVGIWLIGGLCSIPVALNHCTQPPKAGYETAVYSMYVFVYAINITTVVVLYLTIAWKMQSLARHIAGARETPTDEKQVIRLCIVTAVVFFVCLLPRAVFNLFNLLKILDQLDFHITREFWTCLSNYSVLFLLINSSLNPLIYNVTSSRYRRAFRDAFCPGCCGTSRAFQDARGKSINMAMSNHKHRRTANNYTAVSSLNSHSIDERATILEHTVTADKFIIESKETSL